MQNWLVTVKLPRNPDHDPTNKVAGNCPVNGAPCSDITGQHHTVRVLASSEEGARLWAEVKRFHLTRVELG